MQWTPPARRHLGAKLWLLMMYRECLLLAISGHSESAAGCPLYPQEQTFRRLRPFDPNNGHKRSSKKPSRNLALVEKALTAEQEVDRLNNLAVR